MATQKQIDKAIDRLYKAVDHYVKVHGGSVAVIGGIQIQRWPDYNNFSYRVSVKCTGRKPELESAKKKGSNHE